MAILGKKIGMTQIFEDGKTVPVTVIEAGPNFVLQTKTTENDGYVAIQVGFDEKREKNTTKPLMGIFNKAGVKPQRFVRELRVDSVDLDLLKIINDNTFNLDIHIGKETEKLNCFIKGDVIRIRMYSGYNHYIIK